MVESTGAPDSIRRAELYRHVVAEGRRRLRRRRLVALTCVVTVLCGAGVLAGIRTSSSNSGNTHRVIVSGQPSSTALPAESRSCQAGGPIRPGEALSGDSVQFGWLPAGFTRESGTPIAEGAIRNGPGPSADMTLGLVTGGGVLPKDATSVPVTVEGRPALVDTTIPSGSTTPTATVAWQPNIDATVTLTVNDLSVSEALSVARHVIFTPGVPAAQVGDLGRVIPRSTAISLVRPGKHARVVTWLTTDGQLTAAEAAAGDVNGSTNGVPNAEPGMAPDHPLWLVLVFKLARPTARGRPAFIPNATAQVIDAETGQPISSASGSYSNVLPQLVSLVDHSGAAPCPSPSSTDPANQAAIHSPHTHPSMTRRAATVVPLSPPGPAGTIQIDVGTDQGVTLGDAVTLPPHGTRHPGALIGQVFDAGPTSSEVELTTNQQFSVGVVLDRTGDEAVAAGNGPSTPLSVDLVNRHLRLKIGQSVSSAGLPYDVIPPGVPIGTVSSVNPQKGDRPPIVTLNPDFSPARLSNVAVLLTESG
jgi:rod shape-determining protein MreC